MKNLLIIDDESSNIDLLTGILKDNFNIYASKSPKQGLELTKLNKPDLVLLDIRMPELDGYEVCKLIKNYDGSIPVIFVSALSTVEDRLKGYDAGADDFITKPINTKELIYKVENILEYHNHLETLKNTIKQVTSKTTMVKDKADELELMSWFYKNLLKVESLSKLVEHIRQTLSQLELDFVMRLDPLKEKKLYISSSGIVNPLQSAAIDKAREKGNEIIYKSVYIFNHDNISLLINKMPIADPDYNQQLSNTLKNIIEAISISLISICNTIKSQKELINKNKQLTDTFKKTESIVSMIESMQKHNDAETNKIINELIDSVHSKFMYLGLTESQEMEIIKLIEDTEQKMQSVISKNTELETKIEMAKALLNL